MEFVDELILRGSPIAGMSDDELFRFCSANRDVNLERNEQGELIIMSPSGSGTGRIHSEIVYQLASWNKQAKRGVVFDSSAGFILPDGSMRSPDVSWLSKVKWDALTPHEQRTFAPVCPEFIVEVKSPSDLVTTLQAKMEMWIRNGAHLDWLVDPEAEVLYIYRADGSQDQIKDFETLASGEAVLLGFVFDLEELL